MEKQEQCPQRQCQVGLGLEILGSTSKCSGTSKGSVYHQGQPRRVTPEKRLKGNTGTPGSSHTSKTWKPLATQRRSGESGAQGVCPGTCS